MKTGAGFIVRSTKGRILICHPTNNKDWSLPKGMVEPGETLFQAARRELKEETGYTITQVLGVPNIYGESKYKHDKKKVFFYLLDDVREFEPFCESYVKGTDYKEIDDFLWVKPYVARRLLHYSQKHLV